MKKKFVSLILICVLGLSLIGCKSWDYKKAKKLMKNNKYDEAIKILEKDPEYKDSKEIIEKEEKYQKAKLTEELTESNINDSIKLLKELNGYRDSKKILKQYEEYLIDLNIEREKVGKARDLVNKLGITPSEYSRIEYIIGDVDDYNTLYKKDALAFLSLIEFDKNYTSNKAATLKALSNINPENFGSGYINCSGVLWRVGFQISQDYSVVSEKEWKNTYNYSQKGGQVGVSPYIGMSRQELKYSAWGQPIKINTTESSYGVSEQWVYQHNRYVYVDKDVVTCIQK